MKYWSIDAVKTAKKVEIDELRFSQSAKNMVKVKIQRATISPSDISVFKGAFESLLPVVPARSAVALISECPSETFRKGEKVFLSPYTKSLQDDSLRGVERDGFACNYAILEESEIFLLPETITEEAAVFIDDTAVAIAILEKFNLDTSQYILLFGASALNIIVAQLAIYYQAIPIIVDSKRERLEKAASFDIYYTINTQEENVKQRVTEITGGHFADHAVMDTDCDFYAENILQYLKKGGDVVMSGVSRATNRIIADISSLVQNGLSSYGVNSGKGFIASAINLLATAAINVKGLIEREVDFEQLPQLLETLAEQPFFYKNSIKM